MYNNGLAGFTDWLKSGISSFKKAIGIGQPKPILSGAALVEAQKLLSYCQIRPIKMGDRGDIVATLQFLLNTLGYKTYSGETPDGVFGPMTYRAVIEYQRSRGLKPDGIVGRLTAFKIYQEVSERTKAAKMLSTSVQSWINREVYKKTEEIRKKYPEFVVSYEQKTGVATVAPKETSRSVIDYFKSMSPETKKYLTALGIILAAYLFSGRK